MKRWFCYAVASNQRAVIIPKVEQKRIVSARAKKNQLELIKSTIQWRDKMKKAYTETKSSMHANMDTNTDGKIAHMNSEKITFRSFYTESWISLMQLWQLVNNLLSLNAKVTEYQTMR